MISDNVCRICLKSTTESTFYVTSSVKVNNEQKTLQEIIYTCTSIQINSENMLCYQCINEAISAYKFKSKCEKTEQLLKSQSNDKKQTEQNLIFNKNIDFIIDSIRNKNYLSCDICSERFLTKRELDQHIIINHIPNKLNNNERTSKLYSKTIGEFSRKNNIKQNSTEEISTERFNENKKTNLINSFCKKSCIDNDTARVNSVDNNISNVESINNVFEEKDKNVKEQNEREWNKRSQQLADSDNYEEEFVMDEFLVLKPRQQIQGRNNVNIQQKRFASNETNQRKDMNSTNNNNEKQEVDLVQKENILNDQPSSETNQVAELNFINIKCKEQVKFLEKNDKKLNQQFQNLNKNLDNTENNEKQDNMQVNLIQKENNLNDQPSSETNQIAELNFVNIKRKEQVKTLEKTDKELNQQFQNVNKNLDNTENKENKQCTPRPNKKLSVEAIWINENDHWFKILKYTQERNENGLFECITCDQTFAIVSELRRHIETHKVFSCKICSAKFMFLSNLRRHLCTHNNKSNEPFKQLNDTNLHPNYKCKVCLKVFPTSGLLVEHVKIHDKKSFTFLKKLTGLSHLQNRTQESNKELKGKTGRKYSKEFKHRGLMVKSKKVTSFSKRCEFCDMSFTVKSQLLRHFVECHQDKKTCACNICGKTFFRNYNLKLHMYHHYSKRYMCDVCGAKFINGGALGSHKRVHLDSRKCVHCGQIFTRPWSLHRHQCTSINYLCEICGAGFILKRAFLTHAVKHIKVHGGCKKC